VATLLAALAGSAAGVEAVAGAAGAAIGAVALLAVSSVEAAAGVVATSAGVVVGATGAAAVSFGASGTGAAAAVEPVLVASTAGVTVAVVSDAVLSALMSLAVGGGTLAGSGFGIAASMASSAAPLRGASLWASADVAETARKVAATAISTRSNPPREFTVSRIVAFLG
jgi:hypothetical protein